MDGARGMVESGDWVVPRYEGRPFFDKPILTYWLMAASIGAFGPTPGAARLVAVLASLGLVLATAWLGTLLFDRRSALAGALVLATTLAFLSFARVAMSDMLLAVATTLAAGLAVRAYASTSGWSVVALGAVLGLGFAIKGPIALLVAGTAVLLLCWEHRGRPIPWGARPLLLGGACFVLLGLGWYALVYARMGPQPLLYFFLRENLERFAGEAYDVGRPFWFYLPAYLAEGLPWSPFLPLALWRLSSPDEPRRDRALFLAAWAGLVAVPLSLSRGKIDYYLLPVYPALSLVVGRYFAAVPWARADRLWARIVCIAGALVALASLVHGTQLPAQWLPSPAGRAAAAAVIAAGALALAAVAVRPAAGRVLVALAATTAAAFLVVVVLFIPAFAGAQPNRAVAADVSRERQFVSRAQLAFCDDPARVRRDVLFLARHAAVEQCDLWSLAASRDPYLLLVTPAQDASFRVLPGYREIARYRYVSGQAVTLDGLLHGADSGELVLGANFATSDPVAERKRKKEYRRAIRAGLAADAQARAEARAGEAEPKP